jgi:hypothetical protein
MVDGKERRWCWDDVAGKKLKLKEIAGIRWCTGGVYDDMLGIHVQ